MGDDKPKCDGALTAATPPPYGRYLIDDHHAGCWRVWHARRVSSGTERAFVPDARAPEPWMPTRVVPQRPIY